MRGGNKSHAWRGTFVVGGLLVLTSALASPHAATVSDARATLPARSPAELSSTSNSPLHLDLRLPTDTRDTAMMLIPAPRGRFFVGASHSIEMPPPTATTSATRPRSRLELLARQVKREGLPLARLWENDVALVHLGLNPKGKPGLWLVQKIH